MSNQNQLLERVRFKASKKRKESYRIVEPFKGLRFMQKDGHFNVIQTQIPDKFYIYCKDFFTTLVDLKWRYAWLVFAASFILSWTLFALLYLAAAYLNNDFEKEENFCFASLDKNNKFLSSFLFSLETQTTIGYGGRSTAPECTSGIIFVVIQSLFNKLLTAVIIGKLSAKFVRSKNHAKTCIFSKVCVMRKIGHWDCLQFRVGDTSKNPLQQANVQMILVKEHNTLEDERILLHQTNLKLDISGPDDCLFLRAPQTITHVINESSPLFNVEISHMIAHGYEFVVILEGCVPGTSGTTQARTSYAPSEILYGKQFAPVMNFFFNHSEEDRLCYRKKPIADYEKFNKIFNVENVVEPAIENENSSLKTDDSSSDADNETQQLIDLNENTFLDSNIEVKKSSSIKLLEDVFNYGEAST